MSAESLAVELLLLRGELLLPPSSLVNALSNKKDALRKYDEVYAQEEQRQREREARRAARRAGKGKSSRHNLSSDVSPKPSASSSSSRPKKSVSSVARVKQSTTSNKSINVSLSDVPRISGRAPEPPQVVTLPPVVVPTGVVSPKKKEEQQQQQRGEDKEVEDKVQEEGKKNVSSFRVDENSGNGDDTNMGGGDDEVGVLEERLKQNRRLSQMLTQSLTPAPTRRKSSGGSDKKKKDSLMGATTTTTMSPEKLVESAKAKEKKKNNNNDGDDDSELETLSTSSDSPDEDDYSKSYATAVMEDDLPKPISSAAESSYDDSVEIVDSHAFSLGGVGPGGARGKSIAVFEDDVEEIRLEEQRRQILDVLQTWGGSDAVVAAKAGNAALVEEAIEKRVAQRLTEGNMSPRSFNRQSHQDFLVSVQTLVGKFRRKTSHHHANGGFVEARQRLAVSLSPRQSASATAGSSSILMPKADETDARLAQVEEAEAEASFREASSKIREIMSLKTMVGESDGRDEVALAAEEKAKRATAPRQAQEEYEMPAERVDLEALEKMKLINQLIIMLKENE